MKKIILSLIISGILITNSCIHAGSSFWTGLGFGTLAGIVGTKAASKPEPRFIEVHTIESESPALRRELAQCQSQLANLEEENERLAEQLELERSSYRREKRKLYSKIEVLEEKTENLQKKLSRLEKHVA